MKLPWETGLLSHAEHDSERSTCGAWVFCKCLLAQLKKQKKPRAWCLIVVGTRCPLIFRQFGRNHSTVALLNKAGAFPPIVTYQSACEG